MSNSFESIYNEHYIAIFYLAKRFVTDTQTAEDITSEAFVKLWRKINSNESPINQKAFLITITKNACLNHIRLVKRQSANEKLIAYLLEKENNDDFNQHEITASVYQHIYDEIERLPTQLKTVFKMAYIDGFSNDEISDKLIINNQSVRNHKSRALKILRMVILDKEIFIIILAPCYLYLFKDYQSN